MTTAIVPTRDELIAFIWDAYKAAHGIRPRFIAFEEMTYDELEKLAIRVDEEAKEQYRQERLQQATALRDYRAQINELMKIGARDRKTAIRWYLDGVDATEDYDVEYTCYKLGLPYKMKKYFEPVLKEMQYDYV